jgi:hypothetical protein
MAGPPVATPRHARPQVLLLLLPLCCLAGLLLLLQLCC